MRRIVILLIILICFYSFIACSGDLGVNDNSNINIQNQANSDEGIKRVENAEIEVNNASTNVNIIKNSNHSNLSNDELRNRIINAAKNINFNK